MQGPCVCDLLSDVGELTHACRPLAPGPTPLNPPTALHGARPRELLHVLALLCPVTW